VGAMTAALIAVETEDFAAAVRTLDVELAEPLTRALNRLTNSLDASAAMAGDDAGGQDWAHSYDRATAGALNAGQAVANAVTGLAVMFVQTARNYAAADAASDAATRGRVDVALATVPCISDYQLPWCVPPSAAGGSGGPPHGWGFVEHLVGYVWPNGDPGRLWAAAGAWRGCAQVLSSGQCVVGAAVGRAVVDHIPEADDMTLVCSGLQSQLGEAAAPFDSMAAACDELARHIDDAHNAVEDELISLLEWSAGIEGVGALVSMFSFGAAEAPAQVVEAGRIAKTAANIAAIIERFLAAARALARSVLRLAEQADRLAAAQVGLIGLRLSDVVVTTVSTLPATIKMRELVALRRLAVIARKDWPKLSGILQAATRGKGDFGLGAVTKDEAEIIGRAWVGDGARLSRDGKAWVSKDGMRQYRPPQRKPRLKLTQANLESRTSPTGQWQHNGHLDIEG
jgi:hypothetical protein